MDGRSWMFPGGAVAGGGQCGGVFLYQVWLGAAQERQFFATYAIKCRLGWGWGEWWQFVTHAFLHGNLLHLLVNMVGLWVPGHGRIVQSG